MPRESATSLPADAPFLLFDFDSTLVTVEALDELFREALEERGSLTASSPTASSLTASSPTAGSPTTGSLTAEALARFHALTDAGMAGTLDHGTTLAARLALFPGGGPTRAQVERTARVVAEALSPSVRRNLPFLTRNRNRIRIVSGGFSELIEPAARALGLGAAQITAHAFRDAGGSLELDPDTPMARGGKVGAVRALLASGALPPHRPLWIVGDGATDLELRTAGVAERFVAFTENVSRTPVVAAADHVVEGMDALLELLERPGPLPPLRRP